MLGLSIPLRRACLKTWVCIKAGTPRSSTPCRPKTVGCRSPHDHTHAAPHHRVATPPSWRRPKHRHASSVPLVRVKKAAGSGSHLKPGRARVPPASPGSLKTPFFPVLQGLDPPRSRKKPDTDVLFDRIVQVFLAVAESLKCPYNRQRI